MKTNLDMAIQSNLSGRPRRVVWLTLILTMAQPLQAQSRGGLDPIEFLRITPGSESAALGNTGVANADSDFAAYFNPALLSYSPYRFRLAGEQVQWIEDVQTGHYAVSIRPSVLGSAWAVGLFYSRWSTDPFQVTNPWGLSAGNLRYGASYGGVSLAGRIFDQWHVGVGVRRFEQTFSEQGVVGSPKEIKSGGDVWDGGVFHQTPLKGIVVGASLQIPVGKNKFIEKEEFVPRLTRMGAKGKFFRNSLGLSLEVVNRPGEEAILRSGIEFHPFSSLTVRAGHDAFTSHQDILGVTAGLGFQIGLFKMDYAFVPFGDLGSIQRMSVAWRWGKIESSSKDDLLGSRASSAHSLKPIWEETLFDPKEVPKNFSGSRRWKEETIDASAIFNRLTASWEQEESRTGRQ